MGKCDPMIDDDVGAVLCDVICCDMLTTAVLDSGSGISVVSAAFLKRCGVSPVKYIGPKICTLNDSFSPELSADLTVELMGLPITSKFVVVNKFAFDLLLGMRFMIKTPFTFNFSQLRLDRAMSDGCAKYMQ